MASDPELSPFGARVGSLTAFRYSSYDVPFWVRPNTRAGRWHRAGAGPTQYWSLSPDAAWAELIRHEGLNDESELDTVRMPVWVCRVPSIILVDLRDSDAWTRHGVTEGQLLDDDWTVCQDLAAGLRAQADGVIAPCAALPDEANLTIFGARRAIGWQSLPALASAVPAARVAIGRPPSGLVDRVRRRVRPGATGRLF